MAKYLLLIAALMSAGMVHADNSKANAPVVVDSDGFKEPLTKLKFNPGLDQREFERSTLNALNVYDPLESWNRRVYHFNYRFDQWVFLPVVDGYRYITPGFVRTGVSNFFNNLGDVPNLMNSLLQFKGKRSMETTARLLLNTTVGIAGLWDPATAMGLPRQSEDFGQTLGFYGVPSGAYFVLPIFGPSNLRDTSGLLVDYTAESAINFLNVSEVSSNHPELLLLRGVDKRYQTSFRYGQLNTPFEYEKVRYVYTESRKLQIAE
ncbi:MULTISPECIES: VacJ family lipoprotein [Pseudomonas]|uniref:MlaA family lipoprotein n=1 Tax=Pseudomonas TaxID=286 RepID=UPI0009091D01|nr:MULTISPECIES: VacJ family lipoprotein [Pseudomonas]TCV54910.1 phospholipid-binding lipoprotein MlaA [Pseudomonas fluorescens]SFW44738.1 phospholipid-binding lipoprotein MlaA [Pseudomonas sp. NFACC04-2]